MELTALANTYREFYAPCYVVRIRGADLMRDLAVAVSQVEVDLKLGTASHFSFTATDCYSQKLHSFKTGSGDDLLETITLGAEVEVYMGYGDIKSAPIAVSGVITQINTNFPESGSPELSIGGYDHGYPLTTGKHSRTLSDARDSDFAQKIASLNNLQSTIESTSGQHKKIEQSQESDWEFLKKLADRNHFELYVDERKTLHFASPNDDVSAALRLVYGEGLLSFNPEANLAEQVSKVEVYGWDIMAKKAIIGVASAGEESGLSGRSGGQELNGFVVEPGKRPILRIKQPVFTQAEANQRARAALNECAKKFLTGDGEAIGLPEIRPDRRIALANLSVPFSKPYYIQQATHRIDANGYRTKFKVKEPGINDANGRATA
jgi:phage protein D